MENKKKTPIFTVIFYLLGIVFLAVGVFMLYTAISYMKGYLQSYDMTFADMSTNVIQYVISQCGAFFGIGVVSLGIGQAIKEARNAAIGISVPEINIPEVKLPEQDFKAEEIDKTYTRVKNMEEAVEELKVVTEIKLEEMEKRQSFRIKETNENLDEYMKDRAAAESLILKKLGILDEDEEYIPASEAAAAEAAEEAEAECPIDEESGEPEVTVEFIEEGEEAEGEDADSDNAEDIDGDGEATEEETVDAEEDAEAAEEAATEVIMGPARRVRRFLK